MKIFRRIIVLMFVLSTAVFITERAWVKMNEDNTYPVIQANEDTIEVSINATKEELLSGISAWDEKDGDITHKVFVENISDFTETGSGNITYAVVDEDYHLARYTRKYVYTDYSSPKIGLTSPLVFLQASSFDMLDYITAWDCMSGDITRKVKIISSTVETKTIGSYEVEVSVTNDMGDMVEIVLPVLVRDKNSLYATIELSEYIVYVKKGGEINYSDYIQGVSGYYGEEIKAKEVDVNSDVDINEPGVYSVIYTVTDENDFSGTTMLTVVVEE